MNPSTSTDPTVPTPIEPAPASVAIAPKPAPKPAPRRAARKATAAAAPVSAEKAVEPIETPAAAPKKVAAKAARPGAPKARKAPPAVAPAPAKSVVVAAKPPKLKARLVRDSFTMPQADFDLIGQLKSRALVFQRPAKKSELLRAGLQVLVALDDAALRTALDSLVPLKAGRPKKAD